MTDPTPIPLAKAGSHVRVPSELAIFFARLWNAWLDDCAIIDGGDIEDWLKESGVVVLVPYDPELHPDADADEGDMLQELTPEMERLFKRFRAQALATKSKWSR